MESRRRALAAVVVALLAFSSWALAGCGERASTSTESVRPTSVLPITRKSVADGLYLTSKLTIPKGYRAAGRTFIVHEPRNPGAARPLVLLLHGLYQSPNTVESATAATGFSDEHNFTLVYPYGRTEAWNAGTCCRHDTANDVGFMVDLVHYVSTLTSVDAHRVYIWGFSNGAMMAWRTVCQTKNVFAGAGVVAGALLVPCPLPVHVVELHGTADKTVPFHGGYSVYTRTVFPDSVNERRRLVTGSSLERILIKNFGHRWPTAESGNVDALEVMWNGLSRFRVASPEVAASV